MILCHLCLNKYICAMIAQKSYQLMGGLLHIHSFQILYLLCKSHRFDLEGPRTFSFNSIQSYQLTCV